MRATLHVLRDRLSHAEAVQLGAQLPTLVRGLFYEGWRLADTPARVRSVDEFLGCVAAETGQRGFHPEPAVRAVFKVLAEHVSAGEIDDVKGGLPAGVVGLWP